MIVTSFPVTAQDINLYLNNLDLKLVNFSATLGVTPAELDMVHQDRVNFEYIFNFTNQVKADYQAYFSYKRAMFEGPEAALPEAPTKAVQGPNYEQRWLYGSDRRSARDDNAFTGAAFAR